MRCYLAHPVTDYSGSARQRCAIAAIEAQGLTVENPDQPIHQAAYEQHGMQHFVDVVEGCDALAFIRFETGEIGAGVAKEIETALRCGLRVYDVSCGKMVYEGIMMPYPILTVEETRAKVRALRQQAA